MKKKLLALGLAGMMMLGALAGCGGDAATGDANGDAAQAGDAAGGDNGGKLKIAMSIAQRDQYLTNMEKAMTPYAESKGVEFKVFDANGDISAQIGQVQTASADKYDATIVVLVNNDAAAEVLQAAGDMPVAFVNRMPTDVSILDGKKATYVGSNELDSGKMQAEYLAEYFKEKNITAPKIVLFQGPLGQDSVVKRTQSFKQGLEDAGLTAEYVYEDTAEWDRAKAMDKFTQFLGSGKEFDAVVCNNDDMALGCIEAYTASGTTEIPVPIVGIDATETGCEAIKAGTMAFTVFQNPKAQGEGAIDAAMSMAKGEDVANIEDGVVWIPFEPVSADNVADYLG